MQLLPRDPLRTMAEVARYEAAMPLQSRLPGRSIYDVFVASAQRAPQAIALTKVMTGEPDESPRRVTYQDLLSLVRRSANLFASLGGKGVGVAYMLPGMVETHATLWGAETAGYAVPINFLLQTEHIAQLLKASGAKVLVALGRHPVLDIWQKAQALRQQIPGLVLVRVAAPGTPDDEGVIDFLTALSRQPDDRLTFGEPGQGNKICAYFHTGGTTGEPKLVAHTHNGQLAAALGGVALAGMRQGDVLTGTLPLFHVGGTIFCGLSAFMAGIEVVIMSPGGMRNPAMVNRFWHICDRHGVTLAGAVPTSVGAVLEVPVGDADISRIRAGFCGAASLPPAVAERFKLVTGKNLYEVYGMTEASGLICADPTAGPGSAGSVGFALPYTRVRVRKKNADGSIGEDCRQGEVGVLTVEGPTVSPGYRNAAHNKGVFTEDGALNTGDLGFQDASGRIHITGRAKDLIIRSGHNIDPLMIENAMQRHPAVALAAAVGMPDAYAGELPVCYVALRAGVRVSEAELREHAQATIAERPAWPKSIFFVDSIPVTAVGKIYKPQLRCDAAARAVRQVVWGHLGMEDARIEVREGGKRGMAVSIELMAAQKSFVPQVQQALKGFLLDVNVAAP